jgi:phosphate transport system substrate-binding protein
MPSRQPFLTALRPILVLLAVLDMGSPGRAETLRIYTSPSVGQVFASILPAMRAAGVEAAINGETSSANAIQLLVDSQADAVVTIRPMTGEDRAVAPEKPFSEIKIATQATVVMVSRDVWEGGVRTLNKEQVRQIYEREVLNWKQVGGPDRPIRFFNHEHGLGVWEQFVQWIYGEIRRAPLGKFDLVVSGEDARNAVEFTGGSMSIAPPRWADGKEVFALSLQSDAGQPIDPSLPHLLDRTYPLARPVMVIFSDKPTGMRQRLVDFLLTPKCQELLLKGGLIPLK